MKPWQKHAITAVVLVTFPIWILPAGAFLILGGMYDSCYRGLWGKK